MFPIKPMPEINNSENRATESRPQSASQKLISFAFGKIVSLWPADTRDWALAMQAELPQMESTQQSLQWLAGGIMSLGKAWWNGSISSDNKKDLAPVKKPGILAALVTVAALALLLIPSANQGLRAVVASWQPNYDATEHNQLLKIAQEAESRGDAKSLAFVGMRISSHDQSVSLCNKAVALDPSLTWIFSQGYYATFWVPQARDWGAKLAAWDPGNAVAFIVQAQARAAELDPKVNDYAMLPREKIESDPQWLDDGRKALESPRFDSYRNRRLALDRDVIRALGIKDPIMIGSDGLRAGWVNDWPVRVYSNQLLKDAKAAAERGDKQTATREAWEVAHFGELMRAHGVTEMDRRSGINFMRAAYPILQPLLASEGRRDEAAMIAGELEATRPGAAGSGALYSPWTEAGFARVRDASIAMHLSTACSVLFASASLIAGLWFLAGRYSVGLRSGKFYRVMCHFARYSPAGLLVSLAVLAVTYSPVASAVSTYLDQPLSNRTTLSLTEIYFSVSYVPEQLVYSNHAPYYPAFWVVVMALGLFTIAAIVGRNILNRTPRQKVVTA